MIALLLLKCKIAETLSVSANEWQLKFAPAKCIVMRIQSDHSFKCSPSYHNGANRQLLRVPIIALIMMIGYPSHRILATLLLKHPKELNLFYSASYNVIPNY
jgi:hypothetical protein